MPRRIKVFHGLVNYGTQAGLFAKELRELGHHAISVSFPDNYKRLIDCELLSGGNFIQNVLRHSFNWIKRTRLFFTHNILHYYYGTSLLPNYIDYPLAKLLGKRLIFHYLGNDVQGYKESIDKYKWTNVTYFIDNNTSEEYDRRISKRLEFENKYADLQIVCAPVYSEFVKGSQVIPLALDIKKYCFCPHPGNSIPLILHAPTHRGFKGTEFIERAVEKLRTEGFKFDFEVAENISHDVLKTRYVDCDLFVDQILGGWYGTAAVEAMALGRPVICSIRKTYFKYINYGNKIPIIHADPDCIYEVLKNVLLNKSKLPEIGLKSREFVEKIHDVNLLSKELVKLYKSIL